MHALRSTLVLFLICGVFLADAWMEKEFCDPETLSIGERFPIKKNMRKGKCAGLGICIVLSIEIERNYVPVHTISDSFRRISIFMPDR